MVSPSAPQAIRLGIESGHSNSYHRQFHSVSLPDAAALEIIRTKLLDPLPAERTEAALMIREMGPRAVTTRGRLLDRIEHDTDEDVRIACIEAVGALGEGAFTERESKELERILLNSLASPTLSEVLPAAQLLRTRGMSLDAVCSRLVEVARIVPVGGRNRFIVELSRFSDLPEEGVEFLRDVIRAEPKKGIAEKCWDEICCALSAAGSLGLAGASLIPDMIARLYGDGYWRPYRSAEEALVALGKHEEVRVELVQQLILHLGKDTKLDSEIFDVLKGIGRGAAAAAPAVLGMYISHLENNPKDRFGFGSAIFALERMGPEAGAHIARHLDGEEDPRIQIKLLELLSKTGGDHRVVVPVLRKLFSDLISDKGDERLEALLGAVSRQAPHMPEVLETLADKSFLGHPKYFVRIHTAATLARFGEQAVEPLRKALQDIGLHSPYRAPARWIGLDRLDASPVLDDKVIATMAYLGLLNRTRFFAQLAVLDALQQIGPDARAAIADVRTIAETPVPDLRLKASYALGELQKLR